MQAQIYPPAPANAATSKIIIRRSLIGSVSGSRPGRKLRQHPSGMRLDANQPAPVSRLSKGIEGSPDALKLYI